MKSTRFGVWGRWCGKKKRKSPVSETRVRQVFRKTTGEEQRRRGHNAASLKNNSFNHNASTMCEKKKQSCARACTANTDTMRYVDPRLTHKGVCWCRVDVRLSLFVPISHESHHPLFVYYTRLLTITWWR